MATTGTVLVFGIIGAALVLFLTDYIPPDVTAIGVLVTLVVLEPYTGVPAAEAVAGFGTPATVTIIAMYILSAGVQKTGVVDRLGVALVRRTAGRESRLLGATVGLTGVTAGIVNNTPVVAVFVPMITKIAEQLQLSPSKLLLPLSYAAMLGGTLTLVGTATNLLASDLAGDLAQASPQRYPTLHPFSMFEFTPVGVVILLTGLVYLVTVGRRLTPARIDPFDDLLERFELSERLALMVVRPDSPLVEQRITNIGATRDLESELHVDLLRVDHDGEALGPDSDQRLAPGDRLILLGPPADLRQFSSRYDLSRRPRERIAASDLIADDHPGTLVEAITPSDSGLVETTVGESKLEERFATTVLAIKRGSTLFHTDLRSITLQAGDTLLLQTTPDTIEYLDEAGELVVTKHPHAFDRDIDELAPLTPKAPLALSILLGVIVTAALGVVPIVIAALGGVFAMLVTDCLRPSEAYDAVGWDVIFLLAGILPLGVAMQQTGGDVLLAEALAQGVGVLPVAGVLLVCYLLTSLLAALITPVASVVLLVPIAAETASTIGAEAFTFVLAVTLGASAAFMTPIGYQTNLMVYGPGGYRFTDYVRVGAPLQVLLSVVTTAALVGYFGV